MKRLVIRISIILGVAAIATGTFFLVRNQFSANDQTVQNEPGQDGKKGSATDAPPKPIPEQVKAAQPASAVKPPPMASTWGSQDASGWSDSNSSQWSNQKAEPDQRQYDNPYQRGYQGQQGVPASPASFGSGAADPRQYPTDQNTNTTAGAPAAGTPYTSTPQQPGAEEQPWGQQSANDPWAKAAATASVADPSASAHGNPYRGGANSAAPGGAPSRDGFTSQQQTTSPSQGGFGGSQGNTFGGTSENPSSRNPRAAGAYADTRQQYPSNASTRPPATNDGWPSTASPTGADQGWGNPDSTGSQGGVAASPASLAGRDNPRQYEPYTKTPPQNYQGPGDAASAVVGSGRPGAKQLEGPQTPSLTIEKIVPEEIQIGKKALFQIKVRNIGTAAARDVVVRDEIPGGTRLENAEPAANTSGNVVSWTIGTLQPNQEAVVSMELMPMQEGEIGSVATVVFQAAASARTVATRPLLKIEHTAPKRVMLGETITLDIRLTNPGTGAATRVVLEEDVPEGLFHEAGRELVSDVGVLKPGETRSMQLVLKATKAGIIRNTVRSSAEAGLSAEHSIDLEVIAPRLAVDISGPTRCYLDRQATYAIAISNPGTAPAKEVELVARLPKGMRFVETDQKGQYDPDTHAVYWSLPELPVRSNGVVNLTTLPVETGDQKIRVESAANMDLSSVKEKVVSVESVASLFFEIVDAADPIELGRDAEYEVRVINRGTKAATNVRLVAMLPQGMSPIEGNGPTRGAVSGDRVIFEPIGRLAPKQSTIFRFSARGVQPGDKRIRVELGSDDMGTSVVKEECTRIYQDR